MEKEQEGFKVDNNAQVEAVGQTEDQEEFNNEVKVEDLKFEKVKLSHRVRQKKFYTIKANDGTEINVVDCLTREEKNQLAMLIAERTIVLDEETGKGYWLLESEPERTLTIVEAYTNIEVPKEDRYDFYDYIDNEGILSDIWFIIDNDVHHVVELARNMANTAIERYNHSNSLDSFMRQLSNGSGLGNELTDMLSKVKQQEDGVAQKVAAALETRPKGALINFSKRKK